MSRQLRFGALAASGPRPRRREGEHPRRPRHPRPAGEPTIRRRPTTDRAERHHRLPGRPTSTRATPAGDALPGAEPPRRDTDAAAQVGRSAVAAAGRVPGIRDVRPVTVRVDDRTVGLDLDLITEYGHHLPAVADAVRRAVADRVYADTGHTVVAVTITVRDLVVPGSDEATLRPSTTRGELTMATVNRAASFLLGVVLLAGGALLAAQALLVTLGVPTPLLVRPGWYEALTSTRWADPGVRVAAGAAVLLGLVVLAAQLRRWTPVRLRVDERDGWHLRRRCVERRLTEAVDTVPGVRRTRVRVRRHGDRWWPRLHATGDPAARAEVEFAVRQELRRLARPRVDRVEIRLLPSRGPA
ncbi:MULTISPECIES: Asp23/Gls24 family envelope stress response protein [unclassified Micromonospora]|uniref:Asp23/Gls24 family envelope stress response protein n=1 Tax=unclassified Micromonospora TaxID=2617518 RepID=UPI0033DDAA57